MKRSLLLMLFVVAAIAASGQEKRINLYSSYVFDDQVDLYADASGYANGKVIGGYQWGAGLEFKVREEYGVELLYYRQDTQGYISSSTFGTPHYIDLGVSYILLGANRYMKTGKVEPYGGLLLGAAIFSNKSPKYNEETSATKFAVGFRLGADIWVSDRVGLKLQVQLLSAVQGFGGGLYFGTGGAGAGVSTYSSITQFGLGGGLAFKFGN